MSEQRFTLRTNPVSTNYPSGRIFDNKKQHSLYLDEIVDLLNEQQDQIKVYEEGLTMKIKKINEQKALITNLQGEVNRLQYIIEELRKDNYKRFEKINELKAKLKEKEEDEQLYANEILELRETNKEHIKFKSLGGDY